MELFLCTSENVKVNVANYEVALEREDNMEVHVVNDGEKEYVGR